MKLKKLKYFKKLKDPLALDNIRVDDRSHIHFKNPDVCAEDCDTKPCTYICPSQVYKKVHNGIHIDYPRCVECYACVIACPEENLDWHYPRPDYGMQNQI